MPFEAVSAEWGWPNAVILNINFPAMKEVE